MAGEKSFSRRSLMMPKRIRYALFDRIAVVVSLTIFVALLLWQMVTYPQLPDTIGTHYDFSGVADGWGSKSTIWFLYVVHGLVLIPYVILNHYPRSWTVPQWLDERTAPLAARLIRRFNSLILLFLTAMFAYMEKGMMTGNVLPQGSIIVFLGLVVLIPLVLLGWYIWMMERIKRV